MKYFITLLHTLVVFASQDLLVTRSDYVRGELMKLQDDLHSLEEKASNIEIDIRNVMSLGEHKVY